MKFAYRQLPIGWDRYWSYRVLSQYTIDVAKSMMISEGFSEFERETRFSLRQAEMYTVNTIPCECEQCLHMNTEHLTPLVILGAEKYNDREPNKRYGK